MTGLADIGQEIGSAAESAGGSVVGLGGERPMGSGVVIRAGAVLTSAHNVFGDTAKVTFADGRLLEARVAGLDIDTDLAVLTFDGTSQTTIAWAPEMVKLRIGMPVVGLANPGGRGLRATLGFVSSTRRSFRGPRGRRIHGGFEHTALAPPGSSGGPVVDLRGSLVGINTRRLGRGFYLAQLADARFGELVASIQSGDRPEPRRLGVGLAPVEVARRLRRSLGLDRVDGLLVRLVDDESPAGAAEVREGDLLVRAAGVAITDVDDLLEVLASAGDSVELGLVRVNDEIDITVRFP